MISLKAVRYIISSMIKAKYQERMREHMTSRHRRFEGDDLVLPEYTASCRTKQCPSCRFSMELKDACNHMECPSCPFEFCFVCLSEWDGPHKGCPLYNDPDQGHDEEGFERSTRGLHVRTGINRY